jgi:hypothetical protein
MRKLLVLAFLITTISGFGADPKYAVSEIPEELKKNVNVVVREDQMIFKIHSKSKATFKVMIAATIFNANGKRYAQATVGYDKLSKVTSFNGAIYDARGNLVKKLRSSDIVDRSSFEGLYSDNRYKHADMTQNTYPYTIEFEYEIEYKFLFMIPGSVFAQEKVSTQHGFYALIYPEGLEPRYKTLNIPANPVKEKTSDGLNRISWTLENVLPVTFEPLGPPQNSLVPRIMAAPSQFEYDGYSGVMDTWQDFGKWISSLNRGRDLLPPSAKTKVHQLTDNLNSTEDKTRALYQYLQNKTRYVSIQLGIGGFQPFEASVVDETGYGDCKALSNYMVAMLEEAGIKAHYVLISAGPNATPLNVDFSSSQFNHAIVAVPNGADTLWLECTSQTAPFGYMGTFTGDRKALLITDDGARVVNTVRYSAEQNQQIRHADVFLEATGDANATVATTYAGMQYENGNLDYYINNKYDDQKKWLQEYTNIPSFDITKFSMTDNKDKIPSADVNVDYILRRFATVSGKRIFLTPNLMNRSSYIPEKLESRKTRVVRKMAYTHIDTIRYHLPEGIYPEFMPAPVKLSSRFGEYEATFSLEQDVLIYTRRIKMYKGEFPAESYFELTEFYRGVSKADNTKMVFMSKT